MINTVKDVLLECTCIDVDDMTLGEFLDWFEEAYGKEVESVNYRNCCLVNTMLYDDELIEERKGQALSDLARDVGGKPLEGALP